MDRMTTCPLPFKKFTSIPFLWTTDWDSILTQAASFNDPCISPYICIHTCTHAQGFLLQDCWAQNKYHSVLHQTPPYAFLSQYDLTVYAPWSIRAHIWQSSSCHNFKLGKVKITLTNLITISYFLKEILVSKLWDFVVIFSLFWYLSHKNILRLVKNMKTMLIVCIWKDSV
jgi:hypothetical protein